MTAWGVVLLTLTTVLFVGAVVVLRGRVRWAACLLAIAVGVVGWRQVKAKDRELRELRRAKVEYCDSMGSRLSGIATRADFPAPDSDRAAPLMTEGARRKMTIETIGWLSAGLNYCVGWEARPRCASLLFAAADEPDGARMARLIDVVVAAFRGDEHCPESATVVR